MPRIEIKKIPIYIMNVSKLASTIKHTVSIGPAGMYVGHTCCEYWTATSQPASQVEAGSTKQAWHHTTLKNPNQYDFKTTQ
jgi:hypothetical protein